MILKGDKRYKAGVALNLKIVFPLFNTINVFKKRGGGGNKKLRIYVNNLVINGGCTYTDVSSQIYFQQNYPSKYQLLHFHKQ